LISANQAASLPSTALPKQISDAPQHDDGTADADAPPTAPDVTLDDGLQPPPTFDIPVAAAEVPAEDQMDGIDPPPRALVPSPAPEVPEEDQVLPAATDVPQGDGIDPASTQHVLSPAPEVREEDQVVPPATYVPWGRGVAPLQLDVVETAVPHKPEVPQEDPVVPPSPDVLNDADVQPILVFPAAEPASPTDALLPFTQDSRSPNNPFTTPTRTPTTQRVLQNSNEVMASFMHMDKLLPALDGTPSRYHPVSPTRPADEMTPLQIDQMFAGQLATNTRLRQDMPPRQDMPLGLPLDHVPDTSSVLEHLVRKFGTPAADPSQMQVDEVTDCVPQSSADDMDIEDPRLPNVPPVFHPPPFSPDRAPESHTHDEHPEPAPPVPSASLPGPRRSRGRKAHQHLEPQTPLNRTPSPARPQRSQIRTPPSPTQFVRRSTRQIPRSDAPPVQKKGKAAVRDADSRLPATLPPSKVKLLPPKRPSTQATSKKQSLQGSLVPEVQGIPNILSSPATPVRLIVFDRFLFLTPKQMAAEPLTINVFSQDPSAPAHPFMFRTHSNVVCELPTRCAVTTHLHSMQAENEYEILNNVQKLVEANYVDGKPRHHLPSARSLDPQPDSSTFFLIDHKDFTLLSAEAKQAIVRNRNVVVQNIPQRKFDWSLETLSEIGGLDQPRDIQGQCLPVHPLSSF
jgi:hypothetical protein